MAERNGRDPSRPGLPPDRRGLPVLPRTAVQRGGADLPPADRTLQGFGDMPTPVGFGEMRTPVVPAPVPVPPEALQPQTPPASPVIGPSLLERADPAWVHDDVHEWPESGRHHLVEDKLPRSGLHQAFAALYFMLRVTLGPIALLAGFTLAGGLMGSRTASHVIMTLVASLTLAVPVLLWSLFRRRRFCPRLLSLMLAINGLFLVFVGGLAPAATRGALEARGTWWLAGIAKAVGARDSATVQRAGALMGRLARRLYPSRTPRPAAGSVKRALAAVPSAATQPASTRPASRPALPPLPPGAVRVVLQRKDGGVLVPVALQGPSGRVTGVMRLDLHSPWTAVDLLTASRLGLKLVPPPARLAKTRPGGRAEPLSIVGAVAVGAVQVAKLPVLVCSDCGGAGGLGRLGASWATRVSARLQEATVPPSLVVRPPSAAAVAPIEELRAFVALSVVQLELRTRGEDRVLYAVIEVQNNGPLPVYDLVVSAQLAGGAPFSGTLSVVAARGRKTLPLRGKVNAPVDKLTVLLDAARW